MLKLIRAKTLYDDSVRYYQIGDLEQVQMGEYYIGETCFGEDIVQITCFKIMEVTPDRWATMIKSSVGKSHFSYEPKLLRKASDQEIKKSLSYIESANTYRETFEQKVAEYKIDLKLVKLHYTLVKDRLICIYVAPSRVDFRELVKDLGRLLKQRIELFQIPYQNVVIPKDGCGLGCCGRELCCILLKGSLNSTGSSSGGKSPKNMGCCGRMKCCLSFDE